MIIDAHNHADWYGYGYEKFVANMDENGIDRCWLLSWETPRDETDMSAYLQWLPKTAEGDPDGYPIPFRLAWDYVEKSPDRFILGYAPDPRLVGATERLKAAVDKHGVKTCGEVKLRMMYDNPDALAMFRFAGDAGLPVTLHLDYPGAQPDKGGGCRPNWWYGGGIDVLERVLEICPKTAFLAHAPGFWCHISGDDRGLTEPYPDGPVLPGGRIERLLDKYGNLYCDISAGSGCKALSRDKEYTVRLMERHPDRFVYARDYFDSRHRQLLDSLPICEQTRQLIYHGNAERLIGE